MNEDKWENARVVLDKKVVSFDVLLNAIKKDRIAQRKSKRESRKANEKTKASMDDLEIFLSAMTRIVGECNTYSLESKSMVFDYKKYFDELIKFYWGRYAESQNKL